MENLETYGSGDLKPLLEALLLVSDDSVPATELARATGAAPGEVSQALAELSAEYEATNRGFQLREVAGGWRFYTHPAYHDQVAGYVLSWDARKLSQAALETLAVIAYHQPVSREGVRAIRGVNSDGVIASLKEKGLIREAGRGADRGQAQLFGTTRLFLEHFGLKSLRELPPLEDFAPDEESKRFIRERLSGRQISSTLEEAADDLADEQELMGDDFGSGGADVAAGGANAGETNEPQADDGAGAGATDADSGVAAGAAAGEGPSSGEAGAENGR